MKVQTICVDVANVACLIRDVVSSTVSIHIYLLSVSINVNIYA